MSRGWTGAGGRIRLFSSRLLWIPLILTANPGLAQSRDKCAALRLVEVAAEAGLVFVHDTGARGEKHLPESMGAGLAWLDFDGDGWWDLYAVQSGPFPPDQSPAAKDRLWRNRGDGTFEDWTGRAGVTARGYGQGVLAADLDGDGWSDLYITHFGSDVVLRNRGDGTFTDATRPLGVEAGGWSSSAAAADFDLDGDLDLYVARYLEYDPEEELFCGDLEAGRRRYCDPVLFENTPDLFFRQDQGRYRNATTQAGLVPVPAKGLGVVFTDLDGDHRPDLYVANDLTPNFLFHNQGDQTFADVSLLSGAAANREGLYEAGMGIAVGDVDGDADPEIAVSNFDVETNTLYRNLGQLVFDDVSAESGFGLPSFNLLGFGLVLADLDRDGALDAYVANGHIFQRPNRRQVTHAQRDLVLPGDGKGGFQSLDCRWLEIPEPQVGRGLAAADYDNDGDLDLALSNNGGPLWLLRNEVVGGRWLGVRLRGRRPNTGAVGATVDLVDDGGRRQRRWVMAGDSYQSSSEGRVFFGLGSSQPRALQITWPSGRRRRILKPPVDRYLTFEE